MVARRSQRGGLRSIEGDTRKAISAVGVDGKGRQRVVVSPGRGGIGRHLGGGISGGNEGSGEGWAVSVMALRVGDPTVTRKSEPKPADVFAQLANVLRLELSAQLRGPQPGGADTQTPRALCPGAMG